VGANAPALPATPPPTNPGVPGAPPPRGNGAGTFVCDGAGATGGVHGGSVVDGGSPGVTGGRPGCWIGYCCNGICSSDGVVGVGVAGGCCVSGC
jgi:hypothetical protein